MNDVDIILIYPECNMLFVYAMAGGVNQVEMLRCMAVLSLGWCVGDENANFCDAILGCFIGWCHEDCAQYSWFLNIYFWNILHTKFIIKLGSFNSVPVYFNYLLEIWNKTKQFVTIRNNFLVSCIKNDKKTIKINKQNITLVQNSYSFPLSFFTAWHFLPHHKGTIQIANISNVLLNTADDDDFENSFHDKYVSHLLYFTPA